MVLPLCVAGDKDDDDPDEESRILAPVKLVAIRPLTCLPFLECRGELPFKYLAAEAAGTVSTTPPSVEELRLLMAEPVEFFKTLLLLPSTRSLLAPSSKSL